MCAIVDANVVGQIFGSKRPPAARHFLEWLLGPRGQLVVGGKLRKELCEDGRFLRWLDTAAQYHRARIVADEEVKNRAAELRKHGMCKSDDEHVLALAQVSGGRLLYTNDPDLIQDFKNPAIISKPRGKVYTTARNERVTRAHRQLLIAPDLCRVSQT